MNSLQKTQQVNKQGNTTTFINTRRTPRTSGLGQMSPERKVETEPTQARPAPRCQKIRKGTSGCPFFYFEATPAGVVTACEWDRALTRWTLARDLVSPVTHFARTLNTGSGFILETL